MEKRTAKKGSPYRSELPLTSQQADRFQLQLSALFAQSSKRVEKPMRSPHRQTAQPSLVLLSSLQFSVSKHCRCVFQRAGIARSRRSRFAAILRRNVQYSTHVHRLRFRCDSDFVIQFRHVWLHFCMTTSLRDQPVRCAHDHIMRSCSCSCKTVPDCGRQSTEGGRTTMCDTTLNNAIIMRMMTSHISQNHETPKLKTSQNTVSRAQRFVHST